MIKCQKKVFIVFCLSVILIDSVFRMSKNYPNYRNYPNVFKRMWIIVKKKNWLDIILRTQKFFLMRKILIKKILSKKILSNKLSIILMSFFREQFWECLFWAGYFENFFFWESNFVLFEEAIYIKKMIRVSINYKPYITQV